MMKRKNQNDGFSTPVKSKSNKDIPICPKTPRKITSKNDGFSTPVKSNKYLPICPKTPRKTASNDY